MTNIFNQVLELINNDFTINEISEKLNISPKKLYYYLTLLKHQGYDWQKKYYFNGDMKYKLNYGLLDNTDVAIITPPDLEKFDFLIISDLHLASTMERIDLLDKAYNYCIKENIHTILVVGDLIDGFIGNIPKKYETSSSQIDYAMRVYPFDKNILNFLVLGNHDYSALAYHGQNIKTVIENKRHDLIVTGFGEGKLHIKNDLIVMRHPLKIIKEQHDVYTKTLIIKGHTHHSKIWTDLNNFIIYAPTLSDINNTGLLPSMIHMNLSFLKGYIKKVYLRNLTYLNNDFYLTHETEAYLTNGKPFKNKQAILYEEEIKVLKK